MSDNTKLSHLQKQAEKYEGDPAKLLNAIGGTSPNAEGRREQLRLNLEMVYQANLCKTLKDASESSTTIAKRVFWATVVLTIVAGADLIIRIIDMVAKA